MFAVLRIPVRLGDSVFQFLCRYFWIPADEFQRLADVECCRIHVKSSERIGLALENDRLPRPDTLAVARACMDKRIGDHTGDPLQQSEQLVVGCVHRWRSSLLRKLGTESILPVSVRCARRVIRHCDRAQGHTQNGRQDRALPPSASRWKVCDRLFSQRKGNCDRDGSFPSDSLDRIIIQLWILGADCRAVRRRIALLRNELPQPGMQLLQRRFGGVLGSARGGREPQAV
jgi:hypothetical protein